jgi:hypothetical protein
LLALSAPYKIVLFELRRSNAVALFYAFHYIHFTIHLTIAKLSASQRSQPAKKMRTPIRYAPSLQRRNRGETAKPALADSTVAIVPVFALHHKRKMKFN